MDPFCNLCFVSVMLSCLFNADLWSTVGKGLTSLISCMLCFLVFFVTFPCCVLGLVGNLIVSIPDICLLTYLHSFNTNPINLLDPV